MPEQTDLDVAWRANAIAAAVMSVVARKPTCCVSKPLLEDKGGVRMTPDDQHIQDLWRFYDEHASQSRQNESLRATAISIMSGFAGAMVALAAADGFSMVDFPAAAIVTALGGLGFLISLSHYAKSREHVRILGVIRDEIKEVGGADTNRVRQLGEQRFEKDKQTDLVMRTAGWRWRLWALLPLLVAAVGVILMILSIVGVAAPT